MMTDVNEEPADGWVGGFEESNKLFSYPEPNLTSLAMLDNMANIDKLQRQQKVLWPEFSWETRKGHSNPKRCYQMFAPDISRLGYTDEGRVYSIICPQQGAYSKHFGALNVEVTVTGQRGWVNEDKDTNQMAADMEVTGKIWFSPSSTQSALVKDIWDKFAGSKQPFPSTKAHAIMISTHKPDKPDQPIFPLRSGESRDFEIPEFARHEDVAWDVSHLNVQIGPIIKTGDKEVDDFNQLFLNIFNLATGNMLQKTNILSWNVWFEAPRLVDQQEWTDHARLWRDSIDTGGGSPGGEGTEARYYNGEPFSLWNSLFSDTEEKMVKKLDGWPEKIAGEALKKIENRADAEEVLIRNYMDKHDI